MALPSGVIDELSSAGEFDLAARRAALLRRRRSVEVREWLGLIAVVGVALCLASAALMALLAR
jgi:hypothetical protein